MTDSSVQVRRMTIDDLETVTAIQRTIVQDEVTPVWVDALEEQIGRRTSCCLVAVESDQVVGFIIAHVTIGAFGVGRTGWLGYVGVSPKYMGQGVGSRMAGRLFEIFENEGVDNILTSVRWDSVDMLSFFKRLGFDRSEFINLRKRLD